MSREPNAVGTRGWSGFSMRDVVWLSVISLAGLGWYAHSFVMCPAYPATAVRYAEIKAENERHEKDWKSNCERIQKIIEELKRERDEALAATVRVRRETRRLAQLEEQFTEQGTQEN